MAKVEYIGNVDTLYILHKIKTALDAGWVAKDGTKQLSDENFTKSLKDKLDAIDDGAQVNVQSDWNQTDTTADDYIKNKPTIPEGVEPDTVMSDTSANPVQNKVIKAYVDDAIKDITGIEFKKVDSLPATGENGVIYLVAKTVTSTSNIYEEYIWISSDNAFEKIGETTIDLSNYVQTSDLSEITTDDIDAMFKTVFGD